MRIVLDTNVFISALLWRKECFGIFKLAMRGEITICISREILLEFGRVLLYPRLEKQLNKIDKKPLEIINELLEVVEYYDQTPKLKIIKDDPSDNIILSCLRACCCSKLYYFRRQAFA